MFVCVYVCVCTRLCVCVCVCVRARARACVYVCVHTRLFACVSVSVSVCLQSILLFSSFFSPTTKKDQFCACFTCNVQKQKTPPSTTQPVDDYNRREAQNVKLLILIVSRRRSQPLNLLPSHPQYHPRKISIILMLVFPPSFKKASGKGLCTIAGQL